MSADTTGMEHLGIARMEASTWTAPTWRIPRPRLSRQAKLAVGGRVAITTAAFLVLAGFGQWGTPARPAPRPPHKVWINHAEDLAGRAVTREEWTGRALSLSSHPS